MGGLSFSEEKGRSIGGQAVRGKDCEEKYEKMLLSGYKVYKVIMKKKKEIYMYICLASRVSESRYQS